MTSRFPRHPMNIIAFSYHVALSLSASVKSSLSIAYNLPALIATTETMPASTEPQSLMERLGNALVYVLAFPFIAVFIALKSAFVAQKGPSHSYRDRLPVMHSIAPPTQDGGTVDKKTS